LTKVYYNPICKKLATGSHKKISLFFHQSCKYETKLNSYYFFTKPIHKSELNLKMANENDNISLLKLFFDFLIGE